MKLDTKTQGQSRDTKKKYMVVVLARHEKNVLGGVILFEKASYSECKKWIQTHNAEVGLPSIHRIEGFRYYILDGEVTTPASDVSRQ